MYKIFSKTFNPDVNHGQSLYIDYEIENGKILRQSIVLNSHDNLAKLMLFSAVMTPNSLRELADQLETAIEHSKYNA